MEPGPQNDNQESEQADLAERVREALVRIDIMALSTIGPDGPWTSPVQYQHNDELELFFMSQPDTKHGQGGSGRHEPPRIPSSSVLHGSKRNQRSLHRAGS